jgi:hypothetical protein
VTQQNNGQNRSDFVRTATRLRNARPELSELRLDEIKRDVLGRHGRSRGRRTALGAIQRRVLAVTLFVTLFAISTSNAAAGVLNILSGGTLGKTLGVTGNSQGTQFFFGALHFGGDKSDDAGHHTYCPHDNGTDDGHSSDGGHNGGGKDGSSDDKGGKDYGKSSTSAKSSSTITIQTGTHSGGGSSGGDKSSEQTGPCVPRDEHSSDDGKGSDNNGGHDEHGGKDDKYGGKDDKYGGKDDKSSGKSSSGKDDKGGKDDKSTGKSSSGKGK